MLGPLPFYFPSQVVFLDDDQNFLSLFTSRFDDDFLYQTYQSPLQLLRNIEQNHIRTEQKPNFLNDYTGELGHPKLEKILGIDLSMIYHQVYDASRFDLTTVLVVDYDMPEMNGVEFCRHLQYLPVKKLLLTGAADHSTTIDAFNAGFIDFYVEKGQADMLQTVEAAIARLQHKYFSQQALTLMNQGKQDPQGLWQEQKFADLFEHIRREQNIVEYYAVADPGGFLMLDRQGKASLLVVITDEELQEQQAMARRYRAPERLIGKLERGEALLFLKNGDEPPRLNEYQWWRALHLSDSIQCRQLYHYALLEDPSPYLSTPIPIHSLADQLTAINTSMLG